MNTVLVVDDEPDILFGVRLLLLKSGYSVLVATTGEEALAVIEQAEPDVVLLDLLMHGMDGWDVLKELKAKGRLERPPVIVLSAHSNMTTAQRAIELGARDYIDKPFQESDLLRTIEAVLR